MNKKMFFLLIISFIVLFPAMVALTQEETPSPPAPRIEITGVNASGLPIAIITANVFDSLGQPLGGLTVQDFELSGAFADVGEVVRVESIFDDNLPISAVLVIDISDSMRGFPLQSAKEAAKAFVNSLGDADSVAIITFASRVVIVQDYTTDKTQLISVIDGLQTAGRTALYTAAVRGVETVVNAPTDRRVVILLSDGAEFGGASTHEREDALLLARQQGASFYTIGLGFGADRTYLEELADGTNGAFYESPNPNELENIYLTISENLRSEYLIFVEAFVPLDGTVYDFTLRADTPDGTTNLASAELRAPIPIPIIRTDDPPTAPLTEQTTFTYTILGDERPLQVETQLLGDDGEIPAQVDREGDVYLFTIDPRQTPPGDYIFSLSVTDATGDTTIVNTPFSISSIPSEVVLIGISGGERFEAMFAPSDNITVEALITYSQTPVTRVVFFLDGEPQFPQAGLTEAPYILTLSPMALGTKRWLLEAFVETESGQLDVVAVEFFINAIPSPTPTFPPTPTPTPTETFTPEPTPTPTEVEDVNATGTFVAIGQATESALNVISTQQAETTLVQQEARATTVQEQRDGRATAVAEELISRATATESAMSTATQSANITATRESEMATVMVLATETAQIATEIASTATLSARATATAVSIRLTSMATMQLATQVAQDRIEAASTATFGAYFTETAVAANLTMTATAQAIADAQTNATEVAQFNATATAEALATATQEAREIAIQQQRDERATAVAQELQARATATAEQEISVFATETALVQIADETATADAIMTELWQLATATAATATSQAEIDQSTAVAQAQIVNETATADADQVATAQAQEEQATQQAIEETQTAVAQPTSTLQPTVTPITELTEITAEGAPPTTQDINDLLPLICAGIGVLLALIILLVIFVRRNQNE